MININLISPQQKALIAKKKTIEIIGRVVAVLFILSILLSALAFAGDQYLKNSLALIEKEHSVTLSTAQGLDDKIKKINAQAAAIKQIQSETCPVPELYKIVRQAASDKIDLNDFQMDCAGSSLRLSGKAKTREALIAYRQSLIDSGRFSEIELPLTSLVDKTDVVFTLQAIITKAPAK